MNNLPNEVLHNIFIRVPLRQRLNCTLVCRYWYNALSRRSLLYDVALGNNQEFDKFFDMILRMLSRGSQVEILTIKIKNTFDKRKLINLLPNLRVFYCDIDYIGYQQTTFWNSTFESVNSISKIEEIRDNCECEFARQIIKSTLCTNLRKLILEPLSAINTKNEILDYLKNAPNLKTLSLADCEFGIEDFELLHKNLPVLESLKLDYLSITDCELPQSITPATSVTEFTLNILSMKDDHDLANWFKYMSKKYINLKSFSWEDEILREDDKPNLFMNIYQNGLIPLYKTIGSRVDELFAKRTPVESNFFNAMDECGHQFEAIRLEFNMDEPVFDQLGVSNLTKSVEYLELLNTKITSPSLLQNFTSLTTLYIDVNEVQGYWPINLTDCLNAFPPSLTSFKAACSKLIINEIPKRSCNVKDLSFISPTLSKKLVEVISTSFPKLEDLELFGLVTENLDINLPNIHIKNCHIGHSYKGSKSHGFAVKTLNDSQLRHYIKSENPKYSIYDRVQLVAAEELQDRVIISLTCATLKSFSFNGA